VRESVRGRKKEGKEGGGWIKDGGKEIGEDLGVSNTTRK